MIERVIAVAGFVVLVVVIGKIVQRMAAQRRSEIMSGRRLAASKAGWPQILAFSGPGCDACEVQKRILEALSQEFRGALEIRQLSAVDEADLALSLGVRVVPATIVAGPKGQIVGINCGLASADKLRAQLRSLA